MKIKNLTPEVQKLVVREITGDKKTYDVYVVPNGTTDIDKMTIVEPKDISGIFEIEGMIIPRITPSPEPEDTETPDGDVENPGDGDVKTPPAVNPDEDEEGTPAPTNNEQKTGEIFICDICGHEFGSARGLASHKNRTHPDN